MSPAEMDALKNANGVEASKLFLTGMVKHHQAHSPWPQDEVKNGRFPDAVVMAKSILDSQQKEIDTMNQILSSPGPRCRRRRPIRWGMTCGHCAGAVTAELHARAPSPVFPSTLCRGAIRRSPTKQRRPAGMPSAMPSIAAQGRTGRENRADWPVP